ncbi:adenosylmethionine decarboxylase [Massilia sp. H-1]|nr:adenosylmethionine decarboxylase [Massilia sp. H-1]
MHSHFHSFGAAQGVTGVLLLAESHISIHTWPEFGFAAADIFMCGDARPALALDVIERAGTGVLDRANDRPRRGRPAIIAASLAINHAHR